MTLQTNEELQHWVNKSHHALSEIERTLVEYEAGQLTEDDAQARAVVQLDVFRSVQQQIAWIIDEILTEA